MCFYLRKLSWLFVLAAMCVPAVSAATDNKQLALGDVSLNVGLVEGRLSVNVHDGNDDRKLVLDNLLINYQQANRWEVKESSARVIKLLGHFDPSVEFYRSVLDNDERIVELTVSVVDGGFRFHASPHWGRQVTLVLEDLGDHVFGLTEGLQPDNRLSPDLRNAVINVDINAEEASIHENFASAHSAFFISSKGYGSFFDTFARGVYSIAINGQHRIHHDTGELDWYIFPGDNGRQIHSAYFSLIGEPKTVPAWGLGPIGWRDHNDSASEILQDIERLTELRMPFTAWFVDRPYSDGVHGWEKMNFSQAFSSPGVWIEKIRKEYGLEFMTWTTPAFFGATPFKTHLDGDFSYIDLTDPVTVGAFKEKLTDQQLSIGVKGHKIDRADEGFPVYESWHDETVAPAFRRNKYAYLMAKMHDEALRDVWGDDQITFVRSAIHRSQPYVSAVWGGDPRTTWEGLQANFANAARSSFMGFPVWGTDVGGYQGDGYIPEDLYLRWMQAGSMTGLFEIKLDGAGGQGRDRMPWQYDSTFQDRFRAILDDRMQLIPYLYSLAQTSAVNGPIMQPPAYRHLDDENTFSVWDNFYVGEAIFVAPVLEPGTKKEFYLPKGQWRDFDSPDKRFTGGQTISVSAPLNILPRFVKANSLYVTGNIYSGNSELWKEAPKLLTLHAFPGGADSDSEFTYVDMLDSDKKKVFQMRRNSDEVVLVIPKIAYAKRVEVVVEEAPAIVMMNGKPINSSYNASTKMLTIDIESTGRETVRIKL